MGNSESSDNREDSSSSKSKSSAIEAVGAIAAGVILGAAAYFALDELKEKQTPSNAFTESSQTLQVYNTKRFQVRSCPLCVSKVPLRWMTLKCDHSFHVVCLEKWYRSRKFECPLC